MLLNILYLDDEPELCENFQALFESERVQVKVFTDPAKAIASAKDLAPDIVFIDYRLPSTNGDLVAQAMDPRIPKVLVTGDMAVVTKYRFVQVVNKPYFESEILKIFNQYSVAAA